VKLLVLSLVVLPILPNRGFGPYEALNPYTLWLLVVLLAALSFLGYAAVKIVGPERGLLATGALGGLAASTAVTLIFARSTRSEPGLAAALAAGILAAAGVMAVRVLAIAGVLAPALLSMLALPLSAGAVVAGLGAWVLYRQGGGETQSAARAHAAFLNPFQLKPALGFALLLGAVSLAARAAESELGAAGLFGLAALAGLADVDALTATAAAMARGGETSAALAGDAVLIAVIVNTAMKAAIAVTLGGAALTRLALPWFAAQIAAFAAIAWFF
jgi:uncharacterized membrane protein (DUF4010 family)